jgi:acyl-CoA thioesterase YciA
MDLSDKLPQIRMVMLPKDTNALGSIFGGVILSHLDLAAGEHARRLAPDNMFVTKVLREVEFISPVKVGDTVSCYTETVRVGKTSVTVQVLVEVERGLGKRERIKVTEAEVVMVAIGADGRPVEIITRSS